MTSPVTPIPGLAFFASSRRLRFAATCAVSLVSVTACGDGQSDGDSPQLPGSFQGGVPGAQPGVDQGQPTDGQQGFPQDTDGAAASGSSDGQTPTGNTPVTETVNGDLGLDNGQSGNQDSGSGGSQQGSDSTSDGAMVEGSAGSTTTGMGGASMDPEPVPTPPAGGDLSSTEIETYFASLPCGAKYTALGDGGWQFCLRLADGGGACTQGGSSQFQRVTFGGGAPIGNVAQISGMRDGGVAVVTTEGALHTGTGTSVDETPLLDSGVVNVSAGYHGTAALVEQGARFGVLSWSDNGTPTSMTLPGGTDPVQVSANYGLACALDSAGSVSCWDSGGNHGLPLDATPTTIDLGAPVRLISVGQNSICGVTFDNQLVCEAAWYDSPYLPTEGAGADFSVRTTTFPDVAEVHSGFAQGVVVTGAGEAYYLPRVGAGQDNPGELFAGVSNVIASGGDRGSACVQTDAGAVFCRTAASAVSQATLDGAPLTAQVANCPL